MRMTLRQLAVFRTAYETLQVSKTARLMAMSVSAVSQSLKDLEGDLGVALFERTSTGLKSTPAAKTLFPYATLILDKAQEAETLFANLSSGQAGTLTIGSNRNFGIYVLSRRLPIFKSAMPAVNTVLKIDDNSLVEQGVLENRFDVGFISGPPASTELKSFPCFEDRRSIVAGIASPFAAARASPEQLSESTWVLDDEEREREETLKWLREKGIEPQNYLVMSTMGAIKRAIGTGLGLGSLPYLAVREEIARGEMVEILRPEYDTAPDIHKHRIYAVFKEDRSAVLRKVFFKHCGIEPLI